jgi:type IV secretion system protein TrbD
MTPEGHTDLAEGFEAPLHRSLTEAILLGGAPRSVAIVNGTLAAALLIGMQFWLAGTALGIAGHLLAVWGAKRDPQFMDVLVRHLKHPVFLEA